MTIVRALAIGLLVQIVLVAAMWWPGDRQAGRSWPVFDVERAEIEEIEVAARPEDGEEAAPTVLARSGDGWVVRSSADYPATTAKVDELLDSVLALRTGPPIATRAASHEALSIADDSYGRRLRVSTLGGDPEIWLVAPATSRSVYLRRPDEDDVYRASGGSEWSFRDDASVYWDASYVQADASEFQAVAIRNEHGELRFEKGESGWTLADLAEGETADSAAIDALVSSLTQVRMREPVGREVDPAYGFDTGSRVDWTIAAEDQSLSGGYAVGAPVGAEADADVYLRAVDRPFVVRVAGSAVEALQQAERSRFLQ